MIKESSKVDDNTSTGTEMPDTINGRKVKDLKILCSKHGDISNGSFFTRYTSYKIDPKDPNKRIAVDNNNIFCIACLNEMYQYFQKMPVKSDSGDVVYQKDKDGKTLLDGEGNPVPETMVGKVSLSVKFDDEKDAGEIETPVEKADISTAEKTEETKTE